jgi:hypothetical protein
MKKKSDTHSRIPLAELIQEGCDTQYICEKDKAELVSSGFDWELVDSLPLLTERCIRADVAWQVCKGNKKVIVGELQDMAKEAKELRSKAADMIRTSSSFVASECKLPAYSRKNSYEDIIQDLYELYVLAGRFCINDTTPENDTNIREMIHTMHYTLNEKYVKKVTYKDILINRATERDVIAALLKSTLIKIHIAGRNAFKDDQAKASRYCIRYHQAYRIKNKRKRSKKLSSSK